MTDIADKLRAVRKHAATIDILATQRGCSLDGSHDQIWGQCLLAIRSLIAEFPDPDAVGICIRSAQWAVGHLPRGEFPTIHETTRALAKLEEKP